MGEKRESGRPKGALGIAYNRIERLLLVDDVPERGSVVAHNKAIDKAMTVVARTWEELERQRMLHKHSRASAPAPLSRWTVLRPDRTIIIKNIDSRSEAIKLAYAKAGGTMSPDTFHALLDKASSTPHKAPIGRDGWKVRLYKAGDG